jgi:hypothetical protein
MCPDKKLAWFRENQDWRSDDREEAERVVLHRWRETYAGLAPNPTPVARVIARSTTTVGASSTHLCDTDHTISRAQYGRTIIGKNPHRSQNATQTQLRPTLLTLGCLLLN